ncbi:MAG: glucose-6-phosphate dehydrogenase [Chlamydiia bacterium]
MQPPTSLPNPLQEPQNGRREPDPCIMVIFGASGDLTGRKLLPALYNLQRESLLPMHFACVGMARRPKTTDQFREEIKGDLGRFSRTQPVDNTVWDAFSQQISYFQGNFDDDDSYVKLKSYLEQIDQQQNTKGNRLFYLSVPASHFTMIIAKLSQHGLITPPHRYASDTGPWTRLIIEKPFGRDEASAVLLQEEISQYLSEEQVYRIDHYLGKETVQNIMVFRFANSLFEAVWNYKHIDHVEITVAEEQGIGTRGAFWEETGFLRDIVQNHAMQLLTLMAMECPANFSANAIRDEKVKVLECIRPIDMNHFNDYVVRGQYGPGFINGNPVRGYREEDKVDPQSGMETYCAVQFFVDNWRWAGVPFFVRGGKRLPKRATEISIVFKDAPGFLFRSSAGSMAANVLSIRIQPDEGIAFTMNCKVPGMTTTIQPVKMDFRYGTFFGGTPPEAYERLLLDCMIGDPTLFARGDEALTSWKLLTPILERWAEVPAQDFPNYAAGTWGPEAADRMIQRTGRHWRLV